jgi:predicted RNA-binding protein YlxR (DUF448 family)
MTAVLKYADQKTPRSAGKTADAERRCLVAGDLKPRMEMIRFVIAPDQSVVPDLSENLPGHGMWVTTSREAIQMAAKKNLFAKAAKQPAKPAADLADRVAHLLRKRCTDFLGLAKSAGIIVLGESQTEAAMRANRLALHLHAPDATRKLDNRYNVTECDLFSRDEMGAVFGYDQIVYVGLLPHKLTDKVKAEIDRLRPLVMPLMTDGNEGIE